MNLAEHKVMSRWHEREQAACRDYHRSAYRIESERRDADARIRRSEARLGAIFLVTLCAVLWL